MSHTSHFMDRRVQSIGRVIHVPKFIYINRLSASCVIQTEVSMRYDSSFEFSTVSYTRVCVRASEIRVSMCVHAKLKRRVQGSDTVSCVLLCLQWTHITLFYWALHTMYVYIYEMYMQCIECTCRHVLLFIEALAVSSQSYGLRGITYVRHHRAKKSIEFRAFKLS